jgi:chemotaxis regulatin CheY-phosphate phosphatase CheZ
MEQPFERELRIKTSVVQRTLKDLEYYVNETRLLREKYDQSAGDGLDNATQLQQVIAETEQMIPDARLRLQQAVSELEESAGRASAAGFPHAESVENAYFVLRELRSQRADL